MNKAAKHYTMIAAAGSLALLMVAFVFQALGYAPCTLCYWQRWPHAVAVGVGLAAFALGLRPLLWLGAISTFTTGAIGVFHVGVEQKWWVGPSSCTGGGAGLSGLSGNDLLSTDVLDKVVMCDEVAWAFLGLSMPGWNAVLSFGLMLVWGAALRTFRIR